MKHIKISILNIEYEVVGIKAVIPESLKTYEIIDNFENSNFLEDELLYNVKK